MTMTDTQARTGAENDMYSPRPFDTPGGETRARQSSPPSLPSPATNERPREPTQQPGRWRRGWQKIQSHSSFDLTEADLAARRAETFFRGLLAVATGISIVANVAHAWLTAPPGMRVGASLAAFVPPVFLFVQTHAVFLTIKARRFGPSFFLSLLVTILIAAFAFKLSYGTIRGLVIMLGTAPSDAGLWPLVIDLSVVGSTVSLFAMSRRRRPPLVVGEDERSEPDSDAEDGRPVGVGDDSALSPTERRMLWDRAASVVKDRNQEVNAISTRPVSQIADVLRLTHDDGMKQRAIVEITGLGAHTVRAIQRAGADVLARTDPTALAALDQ